MVRKLLVVSSALAPLALVAACSGGGGGGKKATIESFTANPTILPTEGGEVVLSWHVRSAEAFEIEPDVGAVYGTAGSVTITVTESTTFRLTALRDGNRRRAEAPVTVTAPQMVVGTVRSMINNGVLSDIVVAIDGHPPVVTDQSGLFAVANVATPYDVVLLPPTGVIVVYDGLTRFDPILEVPFGESGPTFEIQVTGNVSPVPEPATSETVITLDTEAVFDQLLQGVFMGPTFADPTTGAYTAETFTFAPLDEPVLVDVHALRWDVPVSTIASYRYGTATVEAEHGETTTGVDITLSEVDVAETRFEIVGDPVAEGMMPGSGPILGIGIGEQTGTAADRGFLLPPVAFHTSGEDTVFVRAPDLPDSWFVVAFPYQHELAPGAFAFRILSADVGTESLDLDFPVPARALLPVQNGVIARDRGALQIAGQPESVKLWFLGISSLVDSRDIVVISAADRIELPDLTPVGIDYAAFDELSWSVFEIAPRSSTDEIAGPDGVLGTRPEFISGSDNRIAYFED